MKENTFITHIFYEIDTDPITYPIDAHQRWRSIPVLSHIPRGQIQVLHPLMRAYILHPTQNSSNTGNTKNILSFHIKIKYKIYYNKNKMFKNEVWGHPMSLIFYEGNTDDKATAQKILKVRADEGSISNWCSGCPQYIRLAM